MATEIEGKMTIETVGRVECSVGINLSDEINSMKKSISEDQKRYDFFMSKSTNAGSKEKAYLKKLTDGLSKEILTQLDELEYYLDSPAWFARKERHSYDG